MTVTVIAASFCTVWGVGLQRTSAEGHCNPPTAHGLCWTELHRLHCSFLKNKHTQHFAICALAPLSLMAEQTLDKPWPPHYLNCCRLKTCVCAAFVVLQDSAVIFLLTICVLGNNLLCDEGKCWFKLSWKVIVRLVCCCCRCRFVRRLSEIWNSPFAGFILSTGKHSKITTVHLVDDVNKGCVFVYFSFPLRCASVCFRYTAARSANVFARCGLRLMLQHPLQIKPRASGNECICNERLVEKEKKTAE